MTVITGKLELSALAAKSIEQQTLETLQRIEKLMSSLVALKEAPAPIEYRSERVERPAGRKHK